MTTTKKLLLIFKRMGRQSFKLPTMNTKKARFEIDFFLMVIYGEFNLIFVLVM